MVQFLVANSRDQLVSPEFIGSMILTTLRKTAELHFGFPITKAVMSVPAEFDDRQRNYTKMAAKMAGEVVICSSISPFYHHHHHLF